MWYSKFYNGLLDHRYVSLGIQYFLLARVGARFPFNPVSGNLYHLSFELLLKSYLRNKYSADELENKFRHKLVKLWNDFKTEIVDAKLGKFDLVVKSLDSWERVRYIDLKGEKHAQEIVIALGSAPKDYLEKVKSTNYKEHEVFRIYTDDMDELFKVFFSVLNIPPDELLKHPDFSRGRHLYEQDNKFNLLEKSNF